NALASAAMSSRLRPLAIENQSAAIGDLMVHRPRGWPVRVGSFCFLACFRLCRGPESNWRHMVLQVMFRAIREFGPERKHDDTWLRATTNGSTRSTASRPFRLHEIGHAL